MEKYLKKYNLLKLITKIKNLKLHLKNNKNDKHSRLGLVKMLNLEKKITIYIKTKQQQQTHNNNTTTPPTKIKTTK